MTEIIGYLAAFLTTSSFLPQVIKTLRSRDTKGISALMYGAFVAGVGLWLIYGLMIGNKIIVIPNLITLIFAAAILLVKLQNILKGQD